MAATTDNAQVEKEIRDLLEQWRRLFSPGEQPFSLQGYEHLFAQGDGLLVFDSFSPRNTRIDGFDAYRAIWEKEVNANFPGWQITRLEVHRIETAGDLACSNLTFFGRGVRNGAEYHGSQHGTHVWRRIDGQWRIIVEHLSGPVKEDGRELTT